MPYMFISCSSKSIFSFCCSRKQYLWFVLFSVHTTQAISNSTTIVLFSLWSSLLCCKWYDNDVLYCDFQFASLIQIKMTITLFFCANIKICSPIRSFWNDFFFRHDFIITWFFVPFLNCLEQYSFWKAIFERHFIFIYFLVLGMFIPKLCRNQLFCDLQCDQWVEQEICKIE